MTSYLLISKDTAKVLEAVKKMCDEYAIDPLDQNTITKPSDAKGENGRKTTKSIGIEDIKKIRQQIFLKPFKSPMKAVIIEDGETLTTEAQNALLKVLEEPPEHTFIIIISKNKDSILPTIQSRCVIKEYDEKNTARDDDTWQILTTLENLSIKEVLEVAEALDKKKEQLPERLTKLVIALHDHMIEAPSEEQKKWAVRLKILQKTHTIVTTSNANARLTLEVSLLTIARQNQLYNI